MRERPAGDPIYKDDEASSLSLDAWTEPSSRGGSLGAAQTASWELANSLMQTLSSAPPADDHTAMNRSLMMQQLQSDAARAMLSSSSPAVTMQAIQLLTGFPAAGRQPHHSLPSQAQSLPPLDFAQLGLPTSLPELTLLPHSPQQPLQLQGQAVVPGTFACGSAQGSFADAGPIGKQQAAVATARPLGKDGRLAGECSLWKGSSSPTRRPSTRRAQPASSDGPQQCQQPPFDHQATRLRIPKRAFPEEGGGPTGSSEPRKFRSPNKQCERPKSPLGALERGSKVDDTEDARYLMTAEENGDTSGEEADGDRAAARRSKRNRPGNRRQQLARQVSSQSSSMFRGVSRHRLTQRWEASLWLSGKQLYLGGFESEVDAARGYDIAALACKGHHVPTNFGLASYKEELVRLGNCSKEEIVAHVRRSSSAFSRGRSTYRGVSGQDNRWEARIGTFDSRKNVSFGIHESEEKAARQYDRALIIEKGRAAKTNFPLTDYELEVDQYEAVLLERCGALSGPATHELAAQLQLPLNGARGREDPTPDRSKGGRPRNSCAALIYAEALRRALRGK